MSAAISKSRNKAASASSITPLRQGDWLRALLIGGCAASAIVAYRLAAADADAPRIDAELITLLQGMAVIKALLVLPMACVLLWRFRLPISTPLASAYLTSLWTVTAATVMIWQLSHIVAAALLFHAALFAFLILALRDQDILPKSLKRFT